ncbi:MAG: hypothetical protein OXI95_12610 [bacterium]|nr:hypothetical protein [bacterium]
MLADSAPEVMIVMRIEPDISGVDIVLRGNFNPAILTPAWFAMHGLLPGADETATLDLATPSLVAFSTEWVSLHSTTDQFQVHTQLMPYVRLSDLVLRIFRERLHHTPLSALSINRHIHFRVASPETRQRVGRMLAPLAPWTGIADTLRLTGADSGMLSLTMRQSELTDRPSGGHIDTRVEPSVRVGDGRQGVYVHVNDHYGAVNTADGAEYLLDLLETKFEESLQRADSIVNHVMSLST